MKEFHVVIFIFFCKEIVSLISTGLCLLKSCLILSYKLLLMTSHNLNSGYMKSSWLHLIIIIFA